MKYFYNLLFLSLIACSQLISPPSKKLSEEQMESIFYDLVLLNASKSVDPKLYDEQGVSISNIIYKKYGVDSLQLAQNISFYTSNPQKCKEILSRVNIRLEKKDSLLRKENIPNVPVKESSSDSLKIIEK